MGFACRGMAVALAGWTFAAAPGQTQTGAGQETYQNPLPVTAEGQPVESCADPSVVEAPGEDSGWIMYCTTDPLSGDDRGADEDLRFRLVPMFRSDDLVRWTHQGDAFVRGAGAEASGPPAWAASSALFWAPEGETIEGRHYLFFGVTDVTEEAGGEPGCDSDGAIGYAVADNPLGPWRAAEAPLIEPRRNAEGCDFLWTYDPEVIATPDGRRFIYYGSYYGGIEVRELEVAPDGSLSADPATATPVAIPNRYEGAEVVRHDGAYWLFVSASNCCNGPQTGYAVFAGRAEEPTGPFVDREGVSFLDSRVGGTPVLMQNGNGWVGPGHNTVLQDRAGRWWTLYHAVDEADPYFAGAVGFTRRPALLDPLDWVDGWPVVTGGPSNQSRSAPALGPEQGDVRVAATELDRPGPLRSEMSEEFDDPALGEQWAWLREPPAGDFGVEQDALSVSTTNTDLYEDRDDAPVLLRNAPAGDYMLEAKVALDLPPEGCCFNFVQGGLAIHGDDDNYIKLVVVSIWETRQIEFAREMAVPEGFHRYGGSVASPPGEEWTWLRIAVRQRENGETYTAYTSRDGESWVRGSTWTHDLGEGARIGLVSMGGPDFKARFDYLRVFDLGT